MSVSDSDDAASVNSMLHVRACELYPKKKLVETPDNANLAIPFTCICGEYVEYLGRIIDGVLALSNYRLYFQRKGKDGKGDFNIPLGLIEAGEVKENVHLQISCKDARTYRCSFPMGEVCVEWQRRIVDAIHPPKLVEETYAFVYFMWSFEEGGEEVRALLRKDRSNVRDYFRPEYDRMRFDKDSSSWRVSFVNSEYNLCSSYPRLLITPASFSDEALTGCAKFRSSRRIPAVVWRHRENGSIIARCSQPEVGWFFWRSKEDEELLKQLADSCVEKDKPKPRLLVMDARSYAAAVANRARGGGCECIEYYPNIEMQFMNLPNIHEIRKSFRNLRLLCAQPADSNNWHSNLQNTQWLHNLSLLFQATVRVVTASEKDAQPVLVHCSDGWDRTSQIVSLAELLLDPYYRTVEGFQVLCEREWLDFGHKFSDRCGIGTDANEKCPVFLQWLDCVHNVMEQFPCAFEFNKRYLIKLAEHTYSNLFGTFLCNSNEERQKNTIGQRTYSVWSFLKDQQFLSYLYHKDSYRVLWPKYTARDLLFWRDLYLDGAYDNHCPGDQLAADANSVAAGADADRSSLPAVDVDTATLGNLSNNFGQNLGSMLESAINCQPESGSDSGMGTNDDNDGKPEPTTPDEEEGGPSAVAPQVTSVENALSELTVNSNGPADVTACPNLIDFDSSHEEVTASTSSEEERQEEVVSVVGALMSAVVRDERTKNGVCGSGGDDDDDMNEMNGDGSEMTRREDCDILPPNGEMRVPTNDDEDCTPPMTATDDGTESDSRLNDTDASVQTSVETIVDALEGTASSSLCDLFDYKTVKSGLKSYESTSYLPNGRQQLSSLLLDPIDGLPLIPDDVQDRLQQIWIDHKAKFAAVSNELRRTRYTLMNRICNQCTHPSGSSSSDKALSACVDDDKGSVCSTEISWEAVDDKEVGGQVLWVPDHAVSHCTSCSSRFWLGRRRHHCRGCGKIFCADCSRNVASLPNEQLYDPVRVCEQCYLSKRIPASCLSYNTSTRQQTTCKQQAAAGEEQRNSNLMLPPASPI